MANQLVRKVKAATKTLYMNFPHRGRTKKIRVFAANEIRKERNRVGAKAYRKFHLASVR